MGGLARFGLRPTVTLPTWGNTTTVETQILIHGECGATLLSWTIMVGIGGIVLYQSACPCNLFSFQFCSVLGLNYDNLELRRTAGLLQSPASDLDGLFFEQ